MARPRSVWEPSFWEPAFGIPPENAEDRIRRETGAILSALLVPASFLALFLLFLFLNKNPLSHVVGG